MSSGLLDTSVVVDWHDPAVVAALPDEVAVSAITLAELSIGPQLASTAAEAARRQARLQEVEASVEPIVFDASAARSYSLVVSAVLKQGRAPRRRFADLLIAATAHSNGLDLYTCNGHDFAGFGRPRTRHRSLSLLEWPRVAQNVIDAAGPDLLDDFSLNGPGHRRAVVSIRSMPRRV